MLKQALTERALNAEMDHHLADKEAGNSRNGYGRKTVLTDRGSMALAIPRDREATFDPLLIAKYQRRFPGFDDKIVSLYARGMSTREITSHLRDLYGIDVAPSLISTVTEAVLEEVAAWQARPLERIYPLVFLDAIRVKSRDEGLARNQAVHIALGVRADGTKEVLGMWLKQNEGAKFWLRVMTELKNQVPSDWPELTPGLERGRPLLCLPRRRPADPVHHQCHRGFEFQAAPPRPGARPLPQRGRRHEAPVPGLEPGRKRVDHAGT